MSTFSGNILPILAVDFDMYDINDTHPIVQGLLDSLDTPAILLGTDYRVLQSNALYRARYGLLLPTGKRCYQLSHGYERPCDQEGETCPMKACRETGGRSRTLHIHHSRLGREYVNVEMWPVSNPATGEIEYFVEQIYPAENMAAVDPVGSAPLVGASVPFRRMLDLVQRVAPADSSVLLLGETGTGKEVVAQTIHQLGPRAEMPFVPLECTGLPDSLFESELFGYVRGAFTGANTEKTGLVEAAAGGTLFLDEVGDIPLQDQVKLLRLIETRRFRKVGSAEWQNVDFRLICATNRDLAAMVEEGTFRADLYYRLAVFEITLPPLRQRPGDMPLLVERILQGFGAADVTVAPESLALLESLELPGNIRELRNLLERALLLADDRVILPQHLVVRSGTPGGLAGPSGQPVMRLAEVERAYLLQVLKDWQGDRKTLAAMLGLSERALYRRLAAYRITPAETGRA
ncbi:MAG: sigma-54 interaction domain-containing protein [Pseudomonadota bacterium]